MLVTPESVAVRFTHSVTAFVELQAKMLKLVKAVTGVVI